MAWSSKGSKLCDKRPPEADHWNAGAGLAYINDGGSIGVAYSHYDSLYGIPVRFATQPGQGQEGPRLKLRQDRFDARAEVITGGDLLERITARFAYGDYTHAELEEDGAVGTTFANQGMESRLELVQAARGGRPWHSGDTGHPVAHAVQAVLAAPVAA